MTTKDEAFNKLLVAISDIEGYRADIDEAIQACRAALAQPAPAVQPLTDEQIIEIAATPAAIPGTYIYSVVRAIEAAHGIGAPKE